MNRAFQAGLPLPPVNRCGANPLLGHLRAGGITMSELAVNFSRFMDRIVIDQTGLAGGFDVELEWTPDQIPPDTPPEALPAPNGPSIFTAVEEQLGLKLRSTKAMIDVLVIDHAERPNYN
jgi:uncharacterized protein (TIGR03435 family)